MERRPRSSLAREEPVSVPRIGIGYDIHPFADGRPLVLGGVTLEGAGLAGHSDADAVAHAVADAICGAAALPDLGTLFPSTDERWRDADSMQLLAEVAGKAAATGLRLGNVDVVVNAEAPRLAPHVAAMAANLLAALSPLVAGAPPDELPRVTVAPKRGEGIGAIGRAEGIAVWAVALLTRA
jgi:2-C-methyl-D-erythritol 2,4-cyclodiphosphate synthase